LPTAVLQAVGGRLLEVRIHQIVDARPSDAICLALVAKVQDALLSQ
jgi:hypothetical protein